VAVEQASAARAYIGDELDLFARAARWKRYWSERIGPQVRGRVLDVGAGLGATARVFARHPGIDSYLAVEPDPELAAAIAQLPGTELPATFEARCGTMAQMDSAARFDTILYIDVLEHIEDDRDELARAAMHLSDQGRIVVLAPAHQFLYSPFDAAVGHFRRYDRAMLRAALPSSLQVDRMEYLDSVGLFASLANRLFLRSALPTPAQIALWDGWMVPISRLVDAVLLRSAGKSIVAILRKAAS
jgi:SAM-dependent methyltransferase